MIRQLPSVIASNELSNLFTDKNLVSRIREELGDNSSYKKEQVLVTAFIITSESNCVLNSDVIGDRFLQDVTSYVYSYERLTTDQLNRLEVKANSLDSLLAMLLVVGCPNKYVNLIAWHYKYTKIVVSILQETNMFGYGLESTPVVRLIPSINKHIIKEFGSVCPHLLIHMLLQFMRVDEADVSASIGGILADDIYIDGTLIAKENSMITRELGHVLYSFGMDTLPIKSNTKEAAYLMTGVELRPMQMRILSSLSYRDKLTVIRDRLAMLCKKPEIKPYVDMVRDMSAFEWQHAYNVAVLSGLISLHLRINPRDFDRVLIGALLHDIGKTQVPQDVLRASRALTEDEFKMVKQHPIYGRDILKGLSTQISSIAYFHHVNEDKSGYPPIIGKIPLQAAIVHIIDVYDAMCRQRDYKKPYDRSYVRKYILENTSDFNKEVQSAFASAVRLFLPGEALFIAGIPCTMYDFKDGKYQFYVESINQCIQLSEEDVEKQLSWQNSMLS